jgi:hypothetical protein
MTVPSSCSAWVAPAESKKVSNYVNPAFGEGPELPYQRYQDTIRSNQSLIKILCLILSNYTK